MDEAFQPYFRHLTDSLRLALADTPVVSLLGPRQCGKTTLARTLEPQYAYFSFDDEATLAFARADPSGFVAALPERAVLDEIQRVPGLLRALKLAVDARRSPGRFVLTGSANLLLLPDLGDSLAGRMEALYLQPLSAAELARQPGRFLADLLAGRIEAELRQTTELSDTLPRYLLAGGFPEAVARPPARARVWHRAYLRTLVERDARDVARLRDMSALARLLELLALRSGGLLNVSSLGNELDLRRETVDRYLDVGERLFLLRRLLPWHRNEAKRLIKTPKLHFVDSGLAASLTGLRAEDWHIRRERFGRLLESWVVQQIITQAGWTDPDLRFWHYRDKDQVEVDLVITQGRQTWGVEVKAAMTALPGDGQGLRRLAEQCGKDYRGGVVLYSGDSVFALPGQNTFAVPLARLWDR
ncbi:MAG: ATP-binding protein [Azonexus sp.]|jgi:predicted AAA+ superfamily ATPase|nr:ATP-binding protein [Azonexus sp.]